MTPEIEQIARIGAVPTILQVITETTGLRLSLIARVTADTWTCCAVNDQLQFGLNVGDHLDLATTLCKEVRDSHDPIVISHASKDPVYCTHHTPRIYSLESYIAVPIYDTTGQYFGNVCAFDSEPRDLTSPKTRAMMELFAQLIGFQLEEQDTAVRREQFIAILGHDLRAPLGAIQMGAELLLDRGPSEQDAKVLRRIASSATRMSALVDDVLDFSRGRLGGGITTYVTTIADIGELVRGIVEEVEAGRPGSTIQLDADAPGSMRGDPIRIGQLLTNLLVNAIDHGAKGAPIHVVVRRTSESVVLAVKNQGQPVPAEKLSTMFRPFNHDGGTSGTRGLGLGLYIVSEIARSHGGRVEVTSTETDGTTFTCTLPR